MGCSAKSEILHDMAEDRILSSVNIALPDEIRGNATKALQFLLPLITKSGRNQKGLSAMWITEYNRRKKMLQSFAASATPTLKGRVDGGLCVALVLRMRPVPPVPLMLFPNGGATVGFGQFHVCRVRVASPERLHAPALPSVMQQSQCIATDELPPLPRSAGRRSLECDGAAVTRLTRARSEPTVTAPSTRASSGPGSRSRPRPSPRRIPANS